MNYCEFELLKWTLFKRHSKTLDGLFEDCESGVEQNRSCYFSKLSFILEIEMHYGILTKGLLD